MFLKIFAIIFKTIGLLLIAALLTPLAFFAWRASRPLERAEFRGLSYLELMTDRQAAYGQLAVSYQASHPSVDVKDGICFGVEAFVEAIMSWPGSGFYTLAGAYPALKRYVNPLDLARGYIPEDVSAWNFLPTWWETFELFIWHLIKHTPHGPLAYCRIAVP